MPIFMLRAVRRSADGQKSIHTAGMWPYEAPDLMEAKRFVDATPDLGWSDADGFEIADRDGQRMSCRAIKAPDDASENGWTDDSGEDAPS